MVMLFSAHIADTGPLAAIRRKTPTSDTVDGLASARTATCAPFTSGVLPRPQIKREALLAAWHDESALDGFLSDHPTGKQFAVGWHIRMKLVRALGVWPGLEQPLDDIVDREMRDAGGPTVAITIGTAYLRSAIEFVRVNNSLEDQFIDTDGTWGTLMTNLPQRLVATLTIWESAEATRAYVNSGAHGDAVRNHFDFKKDPTGHRFTTGGGFLGFAPLSVHGAVGGKNPPPTTLAIS